MLNHNGLHLLRRCFDSIRNLSYTNLEVVMVDNASSDGSQEFLRQNYPEVFLIQNPNDDGFPSGMNMGIQRAFANGADHIALLNNDTEVDPGWISEMVSVAESDSRIGAVASRMMFMDNRRLINGIGVGINLLAVGWDRFLGRVFTPEMDRTEDVFSVCGGACLFRAEALRRAGVLDRTYLHYLEDVDLCIRIREKGYRIVTAPLAVIYHKFSATLKEGSPVKKYFVLRSRLRLILKFFPNELLPRILPKIYYDETRQMINLLVAGKLAMVSAMLRALLSPLASLRNLLAFRRSMKGRFGYRALQGIRWGYDIDSLHPLPIDFRRPEEGEELPPRILMGVNDRLLGDGWYPLEGGCPKYRWTADAADCFLMAERDKPHVLQLHLRQPLEFKDSCRVTVWENGKRRKTLDFPTGEWCTLHVDLVPSTHRVRILLQAEELINRKETGGRDFGFQCNEVSLLPEGSSLLRAAR